MAHFLQQAQNSLTHITNNAVEHIGKFTVLVKQRLAEGAYGLVDLVVDQATQKEYVLKRCSIARPEIFELVNKEIKILQMFAGPYVVEYYGSEVVNQSRGREALILLGFCPGGNLFEKLSSRNGKYIPFKSCLNLFHQILSAVKRFHDHSPPVTHRDLKLENLIFASDNTIRLCDFGSCAIGYTFLRNAGERAAAEEVIQKETTPMYRAPEMIDLYLRDVLTEKTDIWALGCIFFTLCFLKHPFQDVGSLGILSCKLLYPDDALAPAESKELIQWMLDFDPEARPSVDELMFYTETLASGLPLPTHVLSDEAKQKREERIQANLIREQKKAARNKPATVVHEKKVPMGVASDSVAAKRLAAKRGGIQAVNTYGQTNATSTTNAPHANGSNTSASSFQFEVNFDAFGNSSSFDSKPESTSNAHSKSNNSKNNQNGFSKGLQVSVPASISSSSSFGGFDEFSGAPSPKPKAPSSFGGFDEFSGAPSPKPKAPSSFGGFDEFSGAPSPKPKAPSSFGGFDEFSGAPSPKPKAPSSFGGFDEFSGAPSPKPKAPSSFGGFDEFSGAPSPKPKAPSSFGGFDEFVSDPIKPIKTPPHPMTNKSLSSKSLTAESRNSVNDPFNPQKHNNETLSRTSSNSSAPSLSRHQSFEAFDHSTIQKTKNYHDSPLKQTMVNSFSSKSSDTYSPRPCEDLLDFDNDSSKVEKPRNSYNHHKINAKEPEEVNLLVFSEKSQNSGTLDLLNDDMDLLNINSIENNSSSFNPSLDPFSVTSKPLSARNENVLKMFDNKASIPKTNGAIPSRGVNYLPSKDPFENLQTFKK